MDSNDIERERGITILSKNTAIQYKAVSYTHLDVYKRQAFISALANIAPTTAIPAIPVPFSVTALSAFIDVYKRQHTLICPLPRAALYLQ